MSLVVLRCKNIDATSRVLASFGPRFVEEQHGKGPRHLAAELDDGLVLELYPRRNDEAIGSERLGFRVPDVRAAVQLAVGNGATVAGTLTDQHAVVVDPDGRRVEIVGISDAPAWSFDGRFYTSTLASSPDSMSIELDDVGPGLGRGTVAIATKPDDEDALNVQVFTSIPLPIELLEQLLRDARRRL